ncbi:YbaB/EbfC family nucleoid-associated protein [Pelagibacteraceae bacterium]|jgi:DNA-binding YbaB/EbfC family protein|nr:YbaB/EbfC family nucleoid-associated protein [Pelagibacteraceae bacterium]
MNFNNMMKQAQDLQKKMAEAQKKVESLEAEGTSGGGLIKIIIDGKNNVKSVKIDDSLISKEDVEILEDLILAAFNDGKEKIQKKISDEMSSITGGLQLPPGFKMPF